MKTLMLNDEIVGGYNIYDSMPVGEVFASGDSVTPKGCVKLTENRQSVLRTDYPELWKRFGTNYGEPEDNLHFWLPNIKDVENLDDSSVSDSTTWSSSKIVQNSSNHIYVCTTAAGTANKTVTINDMDIFSNRTFKVFFQNGNTNSSPKIRINGTNYTPKIYKAGVLSDVYATWDSGVCLEFFIDNDNAIIVNNIVVQQSESYTVYADGTNVYPTSQVYKKTETYTQAQINNLLNSKSGKSFLTATTGNVSTATITINYSRSLTYYETIGFLIISKKGYSGIVAGYLSDSSQYSGWANGIYAFKDMNASRIRFTVTQFADFDRYNIIPLGHSYITSVSVS